MNVGIVGSRSISDYKLYKKIVENSSIIVTFWMEKVKEQNILYN